MTLKKKKGYKRRKKNKSRHRWRYYIIVFSIRKFKSVRVYLAHIGRNTAPRTRARFNLYNICEIINKFGDNAVTEWPAAAGPRVNESYYR